MGTNAEERKSLAPVEGSARPERRGLQLRYEFILVLLPMVTVLGVLALVEAFSNQRILFGSLAASAFLIYLDPKHNTNAVRTLVVAHLAAAVLGLGVYVAFGPGYAAAGGAMVLTALAMLLFDAVHPPAIASSLTFAFNDGSERTLPVFGLALAFLVVLVLLERAMLVMLKKFPRPTRRSGT